MWSGAIRSCIHLFQRMNSLDSAYHFLRKICGVSPRNGSEVSRLSVAIHVGRRPAVLDEVASFTIPSFILAASGVEDDDMT